MFLLTLAVGPQQKELGNPWLTGRTLYEVETKSGES